MGEHRGGVDTEEKGSLNNLPALFETREAKGRVRVAYKVFASTVLVGICWIWLYRLTHFPRFSSSSSSGEGGEGGGIIRWWAWIGMFMTELCFGLFWIITQSARWKVIYRQPFKDRLSLSYEDKLPRLDIFVCTADPKAEPPMLVVNTVLSTMAYNYPTQKLSVYLSDDGGSEFTFYALLEASSFSKHWLPFCKKFKVEQRSPAPYFSRNSNPQDTIFAQHHLAIKKLYEEMKIRVEKAIESGSISEDIKNKHKGFLEWNSNVTKQDHHSIVKILVDGRNPNEVDVDGEQLPTVVYMAREKKPQWPHNFKAGSMNALIRVSSEISNAPIILNVDCDMYSNDTDTVRDAMCFFMDEKQGHEISYVQFPQRYENITKNDIYGNEVSPVHKIELAGLDGYGGALYVGTGCFHRRESLSGTKYSKDQRTEHNSMNGKTKHQTVGELEEASKVLANCSYEKDTEWGKEMGLVYGCPVEDIVTGLTIQCKGWKPVYYNPQREAFLGVAPIRLDLALIQYKRWSEGMFQIFFSKYCPFIYGHGKIKLGAQMGYCIYLLWAPFSFPVLYYLVVPPLCLLRGVPLFPQLSSLWFIPFAYVFVARNACSLAESIKCGDTLKAWWNMQRMWVIRRTTSYLFGFADTIMRYFGFSETSFTVTDKVVDAEVVKRYEEDTMDFGSDSIFFTIISTLALVNLSCLVMGLMLRGFEDFVAQMSLCGIMVMLNLPVYQALFLRSDKGQMPSSVMFKSVVVASFMCLMALF
ncbi:hypothetical protein LguiA_023425 [Lonicera macranthoides]